jgi:hypothetical protein
VTIKGARFKLHAGRRLAGSPSYEEIRRPLASAAILINSETQAAHRYPKTLYNDGSSESSDKQEEFDLFLKEGWNKVEILATLADQLGAERDFNDVSDPYAQIRLFPDLLKEEVRNALGLGEVIASGEFKPLDAFDLEWNKEPHPKYWAWGPTEACHFITAALVKGPKVPVGEAMARKPWLIKMLWRLLTSLPVLPRVKS